MTELWNIIENSPNKAFTTINDFMDYDDPSRLFLCDTNTDKHCVYTLCISRALERLELDEDDKITYDILEKLVSYPGTMGYLLNVCNKEVVEFGVYESESAYDKILNNYFSTLKDGDVDRRMQSLLKLINANIRFCTLKTKENNSNIVSYRQLQTNVDNIVN